MNKEKEEILTPREQYFNFLFQMLLKCEVFNYDDIHNINSSILINKEKLKRFENKICH